MDTLPNQVQRQRTHCDFHQSVRCCHCHYRCRRHHYRRPQRSLPVQVFAIVAAPSLKAYLQSLAGSGAIPTLQTFAASPPHSTTSLGAAHQRTRRIGMPRRRHHPKKTARRAVKPPPGSPPIRHTNTSSMASPLRC